MAMRSNSRALTIDEVRARFEEWRKNRQGKSPIPKELWSAASELARRDGISRTAAELHLDGGKLKRLMGAKTTCPFGKAARCCGNIVRAVSILTAQAYLCTTRRVTIGPKCSLIPSGHLKARDKLVEPRVRASAVESGILFHEYYKAALVECLRQPLEAVLPIAEGEVD